jgi:hypothetical protein
VLKTSLKNISGIQNNQDQPSASIKNNQFRHRGFWRSLFSIWNILFLAILY